MSVHVEWVDATDPVVLLEPGRFCDSYGTRNEQPVLVLGLDDLVAIEGARGDLINLLESALNLLKTVGA